MTTKQKETYRFRIPEGMYGPVAVRHRWSENIAVYRLTEVSPRFGVLNAYSDIEKALREAGAWRGGHLGIWFIRATDSLASELRLRRILKMCAGRLEAFGKDAAYPQGYDDAKEDEIVRKRRAEARAKGLMPPLCPMPIEFAEKPKGVVERMFGGLLGLFA